MNISIFIKKRIYYTKMYGTYYNFENPVEFSNV